MLFQGFSPNVYFKVFNFLLKQYLSNIFTLTIFDNIGLHFNADMNPFWYVDSCNLQSGQYDQKIGLDNTHKKRWRGFSVQTKIVFRNFVFLFFFSKLLFITHNSFLNILPHSVWVGEVTLKKIDL